MQPPCHKCEPLHSCRQPHLRARGGDSNEVGAPTILPRLCGRQGQQCLQEDLLSPGLLTGSDLQGDSDFRQEQPSGLITAPDVRAGSRTGWESAPNVCKQAAGLILLLTLLCQLITALSGTLMHVPLTAIQLSSLLCTSYQYTRRYIFPEISRRCKELPTGDGFGSQHATQANSTANTHCLWEPSRSSACIPAGCCRDRRQSAEMHFRVGRGSRRKAQGKQQKVLTRGDFEAEKSICRDRREENAFAAA